MKLVVAGSTGFVATEIIRQSLSIPKITSIIALARRPVSTPSNLSPNADLSKLHSVVLDNYGSYPDEVSKQLAGANACIWYVRCCSSSSSYLPLGPSSRLLRSCAQSRLGEESDTKTANAPQIS